MMKIILRLMKKKIVFLLLFLFLNLFLFYGINPALSDNSITKLIISPVSQTVNASKSFSISIYCTPGSPVKGFELELTFNPSLVYAVEIVEGDFFNGYNTFFNPGVIDNTLGKITNIFDLIIGQGNESSPGSFVTIKFNARSKSGTSYLRFSSIGEWTGVTDEEGYLPITVTDGSVTITGGSGTSGGSNSQGPIIIPNEPMNNTIEPENTPPIILNKPSGPNFLKIGTEYNYNISGYDNEGEKIRIMFDWGDGDFSEWSNFVTSNTSINFTHIFNSSKYYLLRAIAQDESGLNSSWSNSLVVIASPHNESNNSIDPEVKVDYEEKATRNQTITFNASESSNDSIHINTYIWDYGDNNTGIGKTTEHKYKDPGIYNVTLTMIDANGNIYTKIMIVTITESEINDIIKEETSNKQNNNILIVGILIIIFIAFSLIFIFKKKIIKPTINTIKRYLFNFITKIHNFITNLSINIARRSIKKIDRKIDRIHTNINNYKKINDRNDQKFRFFENYKLKDYNVLKSYYYHDKKSLENHLKSKSDSYKTNDNKLFNKISKTDKVNINKYKISDIHKKVDKVLDKSTNKSSIKKKIKNDLSDKSSDDDIENIIDNIMKSKNN